MLHYTSEIEVVIEYTVRYLHGIINISVIPIQSRFNKTNHLKEVFIFLRGILKPSNRLVTM